MMTNMLLKNGKKSYVIETTENGFKLYPLGGKGSDVCGASFIDNGSYITSIFRKPGNTFQLYMRSPSLDSKFDKSIPEILYKNTKKAWYFGDKAPLSVKINKNRCFNVRPIRLTQDNKWISQILLTVSSGKGNKEELAVVSIEIAPDGKIDFTVYGAHAGYEIAESHSR